MMIDGYLNYLERRDTLYLLLTAAETRPVGVSRDRRAFFTLVIRPSFVAGMIEG